VELDSNALEYQNLSGTNLAYANLVNAGLIGHEAVVDCLALSGDGQRLYSASDDGIIRRWDLATGECLRSIDTRLCAGANITNVKGLTPAQTDSLLALGAISDG
jgi:WD40 repeat protein